MNSDPNKTDFSREVEDIDFWLDEWAEEMRVIRSPSTSKRDQEHKIQLRLHAWNMVKAVLPIDNALLPRKVTS